MPFLPFPEPQTQELKRNELISESANVICKHWFMGLYVMLKSLFMTTHLLCNITILCGSWSWMLSGFRLMLAAVFCFLLDLGIFALQQP